MIYPQNFEEKLGVDHIRLQLKQLCAGPLGQGWVDRLAFNTNHAQVVKLLAQTHEMSQLLSAADVIPNSHFYDMGLSFRKAEIENSWLEEEEWFQLRQMIEVALSISRHIAVAESEAYPELKALLSLVQIEKGVINRIDHTIDDKGRVRDSASTELSRIRRELHNLQTTLRRKLDSMLRELKGKDMVPEGAEFTIRNGRLVIPLLAEHKRKVKGFIHDESHTGQTVFIEPAEVLEMNNEIRELGFAERREIIKILVQLTDFVRPMIPALRRMSTFLGLIDFIRAKARWAQLVNALVPEVTKKPQIQWQAARHPILQQSLAKAGRSIVPNDVTLTEEEHMMVISGPNAGGKSVILKTIGLLQYLLQCGLPIPVGEGSQAGMFNELFIDIGDEQSLENDLSTYSSHLGHMRHFLKFADKRTLLLIDEFGTGTDPAYGGAIAQAVLAQLVRQLAFGVVTTHYSNLKEFADQTPGIKNASMRFDTENLIPKFQLAMGKPGSSYAIQIGTRIGLPNAVIEEAKRHVGLKQVKVDDLLVNLEAERQRLQTLSAEAAAKDQKLAKTLKDYEDLKSFLENNSKMMMNQAKQEAKLLLKKANAQIEETIRLIKESQADKEKTKDARTLLEELRNELQLETVTPAVAPPPSIAKKVTVQAPPKGVARVVNITTGKPLIPKADLEVPKEIKVGTYVELTESGTVGEVLAIKNKDAEVRMGQLKSYIKLSKLNPISTGEFKSRSGQELEIPSISMKGIDLNDRMANFSYNLDIRGERGEEAIAKLNQFMDDALMLGVKEIRVVHGKGDGILRRLVRDQLQHFRQVSRMEDEHADRGGAGVTIVYMR